MRRPSPHPSPRAAHTTTARGEGAVVWTLLFALLLALPAAAREILVGGTVPAPAPNERYAPSAASDGENFFTVWNDGRADRDAVIGTRVTRDGQVLDPLGIRIDTVDGDVTAPQVVWDGGAYLVVWLAGRPGEGSALYAARVSREGGIVMPPRQIAPYANVYSGRYVASNGTISVIAYLIAGRAVQITALDREGNLVHSEVVAEEGEYRSEPVVAATPSRFLVAWSSNASLGAGTEETHAALLTSSGRRITAPAKVLRGTVPSVAADGSRFTIVTRARVEWPNYALLSRTFDASLQPAGPERTLFTAGSIAQTSVLWLGDRYEVVTAAWSGSVESGNDLATIELDRNGVPQPLRRRGRILGDLYFMRLASATNGTEVLVARAAAGPPSAGTQVYAHLYRNDAAAGEPALLSWSGNGHRDPAVAIGPSGHFVAWAERDGVYATRVDRNGSSLDGRGVKLSPAGSPRVAFDGTNYVVAWAEPASIGIRWIAPLTGATVADVRMEVDGQPGIALATSKEATYLVHAGVHVRVTRIPHATHIPDPVPLVVSQDGIHPGYPAASWNGSELLVAWTEEYSPPNVSPPIWLSLAVYGARVTANLSLLDPSPLAIGPKNQEDRYTTYGPPSLATNGTHWLVVSKFEGDEVVARRVSRGGMLEGNASVKIGEGEDPVVVWDGVRYVVAWKEGEAFQNALRPLILHALAPAGELVATNRTVVTTSAAFSNHTIASAGNGASTVAYTKVSFLPEHAGVQRTFIRETSFDTRRGRVVRR